MLREVGHLLRGILGRRSGTPARYGGDEFVLLLPECDLDEAIDVAEEIREKVISSTFCAQAGEIQPEPLSLRGLTCSIGVATMKRHLTDDLSLEDKKSAMLRLADTAMYVAKETGRNRTAIAGQPIRRRIPDPDAQR